MTLEYPRVPESTPEYPRVPESTREYPRVPKMARSGPRGAVAREGASFDTQSVASSCSVSESSSRREPSDRAAER